jgi:hypothetical protein
MSKLIIAESEVTINKEGMYCLNDLHRIAVANGQATESQRPSEFLRYESAKAFISALDSEAGNHASVKTVKGGKSGTYAVELVTMKYAGWINPHYEVQVYKAMQALKHGDIEKAVDLSGSKKAITALDDMRKAKAINMQLSNAQKIYELLPHLGDSSRQVIAASLVNPVAGYDVIPLPKIENKLYTTTELAKELEMTGAMLGRLANMNGMKSDEFGEYRLSKSQHSDKQVEQWFWNESGRLAMRDIVTRTRS